MQSNLSVTEGSTAEKNEFFGSMGHELRNPLANIIAQVETLQEGIYGPLESAQKKAIGAIQDSAQQLLQLIADVVDLGRMEGGASPLTQTACLVSEQCEGSISAVAGLVQSRSIQIVSEVQPPNLGLLADGRRLQQIITELLSAAVLSMHTGGQLRLNITHDEGWLRVQTFGGVGHAPSDPAHLLSRLGKVKPIGLSLLQKLVQVHEGTFTVSEAPGQEVCMTVTLPLSRSTEVARAQEPLPAKSLPRVEAPLSDSSRQPTILIADDQPALIAVTRNYLESVGFQVFTARDGNEAIHQARTLQPDLILMDVRMPVVDGLNAIRQIRASADPKTRDIAIISLSGHASAADKEKCLAAGATAYLNKPFGVRDLDRIIADHVSRPHN